MHQNISALISEFKESICTSYYNNCILPFLSMCEPYMFFTKFLIFDICFPTNYFDIPSQKYFTDIFNAAHGISSEFLSCNIKIFFFAYSFLFRQTLIYIVSKMHTTIEYAIENSSEPSLGHTSL